MVAERALFEPHHHSSAKAPEPLNPGTTEECVLKVLRKGFEPLTARGENPAS
jgi:hypothetical protein